MLRLDLHTAALALAPLLCVALACSGDDSATTATTTAGATSTASTSSTGSTGSTSDTSTSTSTSASGSDSDSATGDASTTADPSSTSSASTSTGSSTTAGETTGTTGATTGGAGEVCEDLSGVDFGDCATPLGWAFDGEGCVVVSGCGCDEGCDAIFDDPAACATSCAAAGECNEELFQGAGIFEGPYGVGDFCDQIDVCGDETESLPELLGASCEREGYPCEGTSKCTAYWMGELSEAQYADLCAASLLPDVSLIACVIWGP
jgi:hypothetical protein